MARTAQRDQPGDIGIASTVAPLDDMMDLQRAPAATPRHFAPVLRPPHDRRADRRPLRHCGALATCGDGPASPPTATCCGADANVSFHSFHCPWATSSWCP